MKLFVTAILEHSILYLSQIVHLQATNKRDLDAEASVGASTVKANVNAVVYRNPLRLLLITLETVIIRNISQINNLLSTLHRWPI